MSPTTRDAQRAATAQRILEAARVEFGEHGLEATTVRAVAQRAGVDPSLVIQHYGSKADLFTSAIRLDEGTDAGERDRHLDDVLDKRLGELPPETRALVRSMLTSPEAAASMKAYLDERVANLARADAGPDAELRAALTVSSILGLTVAQHFLGLDALSDLSEQQVSTVVRPWLSGGGGTPPSNP